MLKRVLGMQRATMLGQPRDRRGSINLQGIRVLDAAVADLFLTTCWRFASQFTGRNGRVSGTAAGVAAST
jgi:hypothetical protein